MPVTLIMGKLLPFISLCFSLVLAAQRIDNTASFRDIKGADSFRFAYDNDYFASKDFYYSQGFSFELVNPMFKGNFLNAVLPKLNHSDRKYGLAFEHNLFTPFNIGADTLLTDDRPYAGMVLLKFFVTSTDTIRKNRLSSAMHFGFIGPMAFGKEIQRTYHILSGNAEPAGWRYQIRNELLVNYVLDYESELLRLENYLSLQSRARLQAGTIKTALSSGLSFTAGIVNSPFTSAKTNDPFRIYVYGDAVVSVVGYNAALQGGVFNRNHPFTIAANDISRLTLQQDLGLVLQWKSVYFEYFLSNLSKEFSDGRSHQWGGFRIGCKL